MRAFRHHLTVAVIVSLLLTGGCQLFKRDKSEPKAAELSNMLSTDNSAAIRADLVQFVEYMESEIRDTAETIEGATDDIDDRRVALNWKLAALTVSAQALAEEDPLDGVIDTWTFCVRQARYLQDGEGADLFGNQHDAALDTARRLQVRAEELAATHLTPDALPRLAAQIESYAREYPIHGVFAHEAPAPFTETESGRNVIATVLNIPLRAAQRVSQGLDPTVRLARSVDQFRALMADYPAVMRWQAQLMLLQIEGSPAIRSLVDSTATVSESTDRISRLADQLPARIREEADKILAAIDERQPELRKTLDAVDAALERAHQTLGEAETAAAAWEQTAATVTLTVQELQKLRGETSPTTAPAAATATSQPAFDIKDYTRSAEAVTAATEELRALLREVRDFIDGPTTDQRLERVDALTARTLASSAAEARRVIDHATWRGVQLVGLVFVLALVYRVIMRVTARRPKTAA